MKHFLAPTLVTVALALASPVAAAQCYADYKAKQESPLRLHYGVIQLNGTCSKRAARTEAAARLNRGGWTLLNVISVFGPDGLEKRKRNAGSFYLRF